MSGLPLAVHSVEILRSRTRMLDHERQIDPEEQEETLGISVSDAIKVCVGFLTHARGTHVVEHVSFAMVPHHTESWIRPICTCFATILEQKKHVFFYGFSIVGVVEMKRKHTRYQQF